MACPVGRVDGAADEWVQPVLSTLDRCTRTGRRAGGVDPGHGGIGRAQQATGEWDAADDIWSVYAPAITAAMPTELPRLAFAAAANAADHGRCTETVTRIELARSVAASFDHQHDVAAADTWLATVALVEGDVSRADRLALGAAGVLVRSEFGGLQYDLAIVLAALAASNGHPDEAATIAGLAAAGVPATRTAAITAMLGPLLPDGAPMCTADAGSAPLTDAIRYAHAVEHTGRRSASVGSRSRPPSAASSPSPARG